MRDLKYLIEFENLLDNADNDLVRQAQKDGQKAIGYTCYHMPEVLLNVDNCFSVRLRAPRSSSIDISTYYMSNYTCEFARTLLERGIEGGYQFLDGIAGVDACGAMNRCYEHMEILKINDKENFFVTHADIPYKIEDYTVRAMTKQMRLRVLDVLEEKCGADTSDDALLKAVEEHNKLCRVMTEIGDMRKKDNPPITGYEFHVLSLVSYCCPTSLILPKLEETLEEIKNRKPDPKPWYRARVAVVGSEVDDLDFTKLIEEAGAFAVVLECVPAKIAEIVTKELSIPTIGIGAGSGCDAQVLVCQDMLGMFSDFVPKFVRQYAQVGEQITDAFRAYDQEVKAGTFPAPEHTFAKSNRSDEFLAQLDSEY